MAKRLTRSVGNRRYKKMFVISAEGAKTEPEYFELFRRENSLVHVLSLKKGIGGSSPMQVLKCMQTHLKKKPLSKTDEAWCVVDKDSWTDTQLSELHSWSKERDNYRVAISNPNFEFWLLLHFEKGCKLKNTKDCIAQLKKHIDGYNKEIDSNKFNRERIEKAVERAKKLDNPPCACSPKEWTTTVYRLVEKILDKPSSN